MDAQGRGLSPDDNRGAEAAREGLTHGYVTTDPGNVALQRVIERNGGERLERFVKPAAFDGAERLRHRLRVA